MMKAFLAVLLIVGSAVADLTPRHVDPKVPFVPNGGAPIGRITNGDVAAPGQFKYQVGLSLQMQNGNAWCGGSLISADYVVTAAHCVDSILGVKVTLGTTTIQASSPGKITIDVPASNVVVHSGWNPSTLTNDIALIKLTQSVNFNEYIQPVKLPVKSNSYSSYAGVTAVASGWGKDSDGATSVSEVLRFIEVPIMDNTACNRYFMGSVQSTNICIKSGPEHKSTCNGDSGGPLVYDGELIGITSFGIALGCEVGWPGVFTRTTSFLEWIIQHTGKLN